MSKPGRGNANIRWIEKYCRIPETGKPVKLHPYQIKVLKGIYDTPTRTAIISFGRKNGKTALCAMIGLLHLAGPEAKANTEIYSAARSREQAGIVFSMMCKMIRLSPELDSVIGIRESAKQLFVPGLGTLYRALSAESSTAYGLNPALNIHDELGQVVGPRDNLFEALETAAGAQPEPLTIIISTQAPTDGDLLSVLIDDAIAGHDPTTKVFLYTAPETADPFSVEAIKKANPAFNVFMNKTEVLRQSEQARRLPTQEASYRNLILNQRISRDAPFIAPSVWKSNGADPRIEDFSTGVYLGLDLSDRNDLTALVAAARGSDGNISVRCEFFMPKEGIRHKSMQDRVPYDLWASQGFITLTAGKTVGYEFVANRIKWWWDAYPVTRLAYDRWHWQYLMPHLREVGFDDDWKEQYGHDHGQGYKDMSPALKTLEIELISGAIRHACNPVLTWNAANSVVDVDPAGNKKLNKKRATGRIDGMIALAMAVGGLSSNEIKVGSVYNSRGLRQLSV